MRKGFLVIGLVFLSVLVMLGGSCAKHTTKKTGSIEPASSPQELAGALAVTGEQKIPAIDTSTGKAVYATIDEINRSRTLKAASGVIEVEGGPVFFTFRDGVSLSANEFKLKFENICRQNGVKIQLNEKSSPYLHKCLLYTATPRHIEEVSGGETLPIDEVSSFKGKPLVEKIRMILGMMIDVDSYP